ETFSRCCGLACVKRERPECTYSILSRSLRRGPDSHTDSTTGRDDPSIQTNVTFTHKNSQESMNFAAGAYRGSFKCKSDAMDTAGASYRPRQLTRITKVEKDYSEYRGRFFKIRMKKDSNHRAITFWNLFVCVARRNSDPHISGFFASPVRESHFNMELEKKNDKRNLSTSSCDISNSSLKDIDNAVLEDELASYLHMVKHQQ
ncbi:hypothetical protein ILUMI_03779, partial [Ignelater luminosus]